MPKMFSANPRVSTTATSKKSTSTNNTSITRSMRLSQLTRSSKLSVNRTLANVFGPTDIYLSASTILYNVSAGIEIGRISSKDVNSFSFVYTLNDTTHFYVQGDKLYTNAIFTDRTINGYTTQITSNDGTYSFSKTFFISFQKPPVVANLIDPIIVSQGQTSTVIDLTNTFYDVNGHILTYTINNDNPDLLSMSINEYKLRLTYNTSNTGISNITITAEDDYNEFAVTMFSVLVVPLNPQYNITVNPLPDALPDPIVNLINDEIISYTELDSSYINISVDDYNILSEDEKRNLIKTNITSLISKYGSTINPDTGNVDQDVILDVYAPIDMLPFPSLGFNIDKIRIIDGSNQGNVDITNNIDNSALYVYTKPGSIVSISLINGVVIVEQLTNTTFNVSINNNPSEVKNTGDFINLPNDRVIILSSILITKNNPPVAYDINYSFIEDTTLNVIDLSGSDIDIETNRVSTNYIRYIISTLPQHGIIDVLENEDLVSKEIKYTPTANYFGPDTFSYYVKDNYGIVSNTATVNINVINVNDAPVFNSTPITTTVEDSVYTYNISASDLDFETVSFTSENLPSWLTLTNNGNNIAILTGTPLQEHVGNNYITIIATDQVGGTTKQEFTISVANLNDAPVFTSSDITTTNEDSVYTYTITVSDEDGDISTITANTLPNWLTLTDNGNNTATLTGTPLQEHVGDNDVKIVANDSNGGVTNHSFTISVANVNDPAIFTSIDITTTNEDSLYTYTITVSDEDGDLNNITANTLPTWLTLTDNGDNTATLTGTPLQENVGDNNVIIVASDPNGGVTNHSFTISVANVNDAPVFTSSDITSTNEDSVYTYTITVSDEDGDINNITANTLPTWLTLTDNGDNTATLTGTPLQEHVGDNNVIIVASDPNGGVTNHSFTISVANVNDAPVFTSSDITTTNEDSVYTYTITISDEDGDVSTMTANTLPNWLTLTDNGDNTATLTGTPLQENVGDNNVIIVASDPNGGVTNHSFTISVANVNDAPVFTSSDITTTNEDSVYTYTITVSDEDGDISAITANTLPNWLTLTDNGDNTATLTGTSLQENVGDNNVIIVANDSNGGVTNHSFTISVANVNDPAIFTSIDITTTNEDSVYTYTITVSDEDGDINNITANTLPTWLTLTDNGDNTAILTGTPLQENVGDNNIIIVASDPNGGVTNHSFTISVANVNDAPVFTSSDITTTNEDSVYTYTITISDEDGDISAITANTLPNWLTLTDNGDNTATLTGTPLQEHVGDNNVIIVASDPNGGVTNHSFTISVANVNDAPVFTSSDITTTNEDSVYTYTITISDEDGDISAITANTLPTWLTLTDNGDNTATLTGTPLQEHIGDNNVIIVASDPNGGVTNHSFTISVANVNDAPVFTSSDITTTNEDSVYTYTITVSDEDGDISAITANTLPTWLTLTDNGDNTATLTGTPLQEHVGDNNVIIIANDPNGGVTNHSFTISVANVNDAPVFTSSDITTTNEDSVYTYTITVSDEDGDISTITANTLPNWLTLTDNGDNTAILTGTPLQQHVGDNNVIIVASDPDGGVTNHSFTISVANVNDAPVFTSSDITTTNEDSVYTYTITVSDEDGDISTITANTLPNWLTLTDNGDNTATLTGTPLQQHLGNNSVIIVANDQNGGVTNHSFTISVANVNDAAIFTSSDITTANEDSVYTYTITVSDEDGDINNITANTLPNWLTLTDNGDNTATLTGTPLQGNLGNNQVVIVADDKNGGITNHSFTISVANMNDAPIFTSSDITTTNEDSVYTYTITVSDEDGDISTITSNTLPTWLTLTDNGNNTATLTGTPLQEHVGNNSVIVVANDQNGGITNHSFVINVINVNDQPTGQLDISGVVMEGETVEADTTDINDEDGILTYTYQWELSTDNLTWTVLTGETNTTYIVPKDQGHVGDYIRVKAVSSDPYGNTTSHTSSSYEILIFNDPPTDIQISSNEIYESYEIGKEIGTLTTIDIDSTVFTYSVNDNKFIINNDKLLSNHVFEYGPNNTYAIDITTTDETGITYTKTINILVERLWEYTILSSTTVAIGDNTNNLANGTVLGTNLTGSIIIPSTIYDNGNTYTVTNIYQNALNGSNVDKITFSGDTTYTLDIPLKQNFQVTQVDEDYVLHQLEEV